MNKLTREISHQFSNFLRLLDTKKKSKKGMRSWYWNLSIMRVRMMRGKTALGRRRYLIRFLCQNREMMRKIRMRKSQGVLLRHGMSHTASLMKFFHGVKRRWREINSYNVPTPQRRYPHPRWILEVWWPPQDSLIPTSPLAVIPRWPWVERPLKAWVTQVRAPSSADGPFSRGIWTSRSSFLHPIRQ